MILEVIVKTNQKEQSFFQEDNILRIGLKSKPVKGKANKELLSLLEKRFRKSARIISGASSKRKRVELL